MFAWTSKTPDLNLDSSFDSKCALDCALTAKGDGHCDSACFNDACEWDGGDCDHECGIANGCHASMLGNGQCDEDCMNSACGYDLPDVIATLARARATPPLTSASPIHTAHDACIVAPLGPKRVCFPGSETRIDLVFGTCASQCACNNVQEAPYGYGSDGSADFEDYGNNEHKCWIIRSGSDDRHVSLSFARLDTEQSYDKIRIFDGPDVSSSPLHPGDGFSGMMSVEERNGIVLTSTGSSLLIKFDTDDSWTESGFSYGWTTLPKPTSSESQCALDCLPGNLGDGVCHTACMNGVRADHRSLGAKSVTHDVTSKCSAPALFTHLDCTRRTLLPLCVIRFPTSLQASASGIGAIVASR